MSHHASIGDTEPPSQEDRPLPRRSALPRRPLVGLALAFVAGTAIGLRLDVSFATLLAAGTLLTCGTAVPAWAPGTARMKVSPGISLAMLLLAVACVGAANARLARVAPSAPGLTVPAPGTDLEIKAIVTDEPVSAGTRTGGTAYRFPADISAVRYATNTPWQAVSGSVRVRWFGPTNRLPAYGDKWQWRGRLEAFVPERGREPARATARDPILTFTATVSDGERLSSGNGNPFVAWCLRLRNDSCATITAGIRDFPEQVGILVSLVLGYRSQIPAELYQAFAATGTLHVFAVSGSHVVILAGAIVFVLSACGLPRTRWALLLGPALVVYTIMTGLQPSAVRACIMGIAYAAAPLFHRRADLYTSLALAAIVILAIDPADLVNVGFILSFVAVIGLGLFYPVFAAPLRRRIAPDPLQLLPDPPWKQTVRTGLHHAIGLMAMSMAAWVVTTPLTAWYFGLFSPIALVGNLAAVPLASLILITGMIALVGGSLALSVATVFNHANLVLAALLGQSIRMLVAVPFGHIRVGAVPVLAVAIWYAILLFWRFRLWVDAVPEESPDSCRT